MQDAALFGYLIVTLGFWVKIWFFPNPAPPFEFEMMHNASPEVHDNIAEKTTSRRWRFLITSGQRLLELVFCALWPAWGLFFIITVLLNFVFNRAHPRAESSYQRIGEPQTIAAIEQSHYYFDPLEGSPAEPFGHLHTAWLNFVGSDKTAQLCPYENITVKASRKTTYFGYVRVDADQQVSDVFYYEYASDDINDI
ncbi:hypothetical protein [Alteromonas lipotrueiana]|uniref:hypothetical protein n=1 Tax=Alteromonas lipotrueiana TaxID=2803815 RepID=UPI001C4713D2|nr:hypothetical protein [Alteromonas lipotrueiana]